MRGHRDTPGDRPEIATISFRDSMEAIRAFAGDQPERARYYPEDGDCLIARTRHVEHYDTPTYTMTSRATITPPVTPMTMAMNRSWP